MPPDHELVCTHGYFCTNEITIKQQGNQITRIKQQTNGIMGIGAYTEPTCLRPARKSCIALTCQWPA